MKQLLLFTLTASTLFADSLYKLLPDNGSQERLMAISAINSNCPKDKASSFTVCVLEYIQELNEDPAKPGYSLQVLDVQGSLTVR